MVLLPDAFSVEGLEPKWLRHGYSINLIKLKSSTDQSKILTTEQSMIEILMMIQFSLFSSIVSQFKGEFLWGVQTSDNHRYHR